MAAGVAAGPVAALAAPPRAGHRRGETPHLALVCEHHHRRLHKTNQTLTRRTDGAWQLTDYTTALHTRQKTCHLPGIPPGLPPD